MNKKAKGAEKPFWRSNYGILLVVGLLVLVAAQSLVWPNRRVQLDYSQFKKEVRAGHISKVKLGQSEITGTWQKSGAESVSFYTPCRGLDQRDPKLTELLEEHDVEFRGDTDPSGVQAALLYLLP